MVYFVFEVKTAENYNVLEIGFWKRLETKASWKKRRDNKHGKLNIAADVDTNWEKLKCTCMCL